jgi:hypothetical protein
MSPTDLTALAVLTLALADLNPCDHIEELRGEDEDKDINRIREAGRAIMTAKVRMTRVYYRGLVDAGFSREEALELTKKFKPEMEFKA